MTTKVDGQKRVGLSCTGYELREMFSVATRWLEKNTSAINDLNVFPVPDGDTGILYYLMNNSNSKPLNVRNIALFCTR